MDDGNRQTGAGRAGEAAPSLTPEPSDNTAAPPSQKADANPAFDESLTEELAALIDDGRTYAQAELAFQKTRAKLAGQSVGIAIGSVLVALILLHIAFLALSVGLVIALAPLVTIWGAIAIVVGALLLLTTALIIVAVKRGKKLSALFASPDGDSAK